MKDQVGVKERIMNTACRLFYEQGYQATGINQIIEEAQIAKSSLYQHFASKELLLNEYLQTHKTQWATEIADFTKDVPDGKEKLLAFFDFRKKRLEKNHYKGCTFSRVVYELPNLDESSADIIRTHKNTIKAFIAEQLEVIKDPFPEDALNKMTGMIFNLSEGAVLQSTLFNTSQPLDDSKKVVAHLLQTV
ncbi:TetR/AcrR family transcriptional regulator [Mucilaginibacter agri]|uniref:TetR family transcriptional regulator n=1 Tax=Mucilaginibacter agri TaxID=2695265 RepID=A0A965ZHE3_9SPHI|nr:TetR/AcrR family transcriptional regulator [Mucilaginibacter agri]NCD70019.1 TetR family transcriptional regulator [Mucilaginibacter agri]